MKTKGGDMKGKAYVTNGKEKYPVKVVHWWPGREYKSAPATLFYSAWFMGRRYATIAGVNVPEESPSEWGKIRRVAIAECSKHDQPNRKLGRQIALARLVKMLNGDGAVDIWNPWELVEE